MGGYPGADSQDAVSCLVIVRSGAQRDLAENCALIRESRADNFKSSRDRPRAGYLGLH